MAATRLGSDTIAAVLTPECLNIAAGTLVDLPHPAAPTITNTRESSNVDVILSL